MKRKVKVIFATLLCALGIVTTTVSAVSVTKSYRYDWNVYTSTDMNYHNYQYVNIPSWSSYSYRDHYKVGGDWNYNRYEVVLHYTGGY